MPYLTAFNKNIGLIKQLGESNAHLAWAVALYLEEPDVEALASEGITDGPNDKKIDFIYFDKDGKRLIFAQGYYSASTKDSAPANKASDLNTAAAWLVSGDVEQVPPQLRSAFEDFREAIEEGEVDTIDLLFVHNLPESVNVTRELQTAAQHLRKALGEPEKLTITSRELGSSIIEHLFATQESQIEVKDEIDFPVPVAFKESGPNWQASVASVPGLWLHQLYATHSDRLFSANYRGFLGITRRRRINTGIRQSAETKPKDFWVFNNGITLLTLGIKETKGGIKLTGISIINGAQTTGSIGSTDLTKNDLRDVKVLCRVIQSSDAQTINDIVKFNNTQNEITTWDQYSNDPEQNRIASEFETMGYSYSRKRGFRTEDGEIGIEEVMQPLLAFHGRYQDANRGKGQIFDRKPLYTNAFEGKKARHVLFVYSLARAIDDRRLALKAKSIAGTIISIEEEQLALLRNLRFKSFLMAVTAAVLESIVGRKVDPVTVAFDTSTAEAKKNGLIDLIARWVPVVETILSFIATRSNAANLSANLSNDDFFNQTIKEVSSLLYASKAGQQHADFVALVSDS